MPVECIDTLNPDDLAWGTDGAPTEGEGDHENSPPDEENAALGQGSGPEEAEDSDDE
jgi:hypothetical protein